MSSVSEVKEDNDIDINGPVPEHLDTLTEGLIEGKLTFSGPQLYQLLKTLKELEDLEIPEIRDQTSSKDRDEYRDWRMLAWRLNASMRGLCFLSLLDHPENPTSEAWTAIIHLQRLVIASRNTSQQKLQTVVQLGVKRKAQTGDEEDQDDNIAEGYGDQRAKRAKIDIKFVRSVPTKTTASLAHLLTGKICSALSTKYRSGP
jgi:hypothetical protein